MMRSYLTKDVLEMAAEDLIDTFGFNVDQIDVVCVLNQHFGDIVENYFIEDDRYFDEE